MKYKVSFIKPTFPDKEHIAADFADILDSNWFTNFGPFERRLCSRIAGLYPSGANVTTIANATLGLQAAVEILFTAEGEKNQVLVPSFTFAAGPEVLIRAGFRPIFIDIEAKNWQPSLAQAQAYIKENQGLVAGILLCNSFGVGNPEVGQWEDLARDYSLPLIIDSAAGFGSMYDATERVGLRGDCEVFSMHATKPFAVGEGGLVLSRDENFIEKVRSYQNFGFGKDRLVNQIGTNAKLQELNCAIGLRQLEGYEARLKRRRKTLRLYEQSLSELEFIANGDLSTVPFASATAPTAADADLIAEGLDAAGIEVRRYYAPLHLQHSLAKHAQCAGTLAITEDVAERILSLPVHDDMSEASLALVIDTISGRLG